jgi:signal transduction histidine kinase/CheY-like chemotaxis protein
MRDILHRKRVEEALRESEQRLEDIFGFLPDPTFVIDREGKIMAWNRAIEEFTGAKAETMIGKGDHEYSLPRYGTRRPALIDFVLNPNLEIANLYRFFEAEGDVLVAETDLEISGKKHTLWIKARPLYDSKGEVAGAIETFRDITERRDLEMQFRQSQKMEAFGQLAAGVAHDFNNILTVIQGNASLLQGHEVGAAERENGAAEICAASRRASNLTRQLLTFSQRQVFQPKAMDLNGVVADMIKMLRRLIGENIALEARYANEAMPVNADPVMMEQILVNLAVNSRDAMPEGGRLLLQTGSATFSKADVASKPNRRPGNFIRFSVTDTGVGIAPENLPHIFEPFFTTKEPGKGTGLGLATVFGIVKQHHGWIELESQVNTGTTFHIYLPRWEQPLPAAPGRVETHAIRGGREGILLVEDDTAVRQFFRRVLESKGYFVHDVGSGVDALQLWQRHPNIDLLLTDVVMPGGVSGRELADRLRAENPKLKVMYCSGYTDEMLGKDSALRVNGNFLEKPFEPDKLLQRVRDCLDAPE